MLAIVCATAYGILSGYDIRVNGCTAVSFILLLTQRTMKGAAMSTAHL